jgi:ankyrin repeat protein
VSLQCIDIIKLLIQSYPNLNLNQRNKQDATPLHLAVIYNDFETIQCLIQSGADAKLAMKSKTCLQLSTELNHENLIEFFSKLV